MSWGSWILLLVYPFAFLFGLGSLAPAQRSRLLALETVKLLRLRRFFRWCFGRADAWRRTVLWANVAVGIALGIYTGILLSSLGARPLWASAALGPLFLVSGLSTGAAFAHMVARDPAEQSTLLHADNAFLMVELALIALFLVGLLTSGAVHSNAAALLLGGPYTAVFWVFVVGLGIVVPLLIQSLMASHRIGHTLVAPLLVMLGGLALRFVIVSAGQYSHWISP